MSYMISAGGDTSKAIQNGDIMKLKDLLIAERDSVRNSLVELLDPASLHQRQGCVQGLNAVINLLPK